MQLCKTIRFLQKLLYFEGKGGSTDLDSVGAKRLDTGYDINTSLWQQPTWKTTPCWKAVALISLNCEYRGKWRSSQRVTWRTSIYITIAFLRMKAPIEIWHNNDKVYKYRKKRWILGVWELQRDDYMASIKNTARNNWVFFSTMVIQHAADNTHVVGLCDLTAHFTY